DRAVVPAPHGSLVEYLAVRLILERHAIAYVANRALPHGEPLSQVRDAARAAMGVHTGPSTEQRAFVLFQLAQVMGWCADDLFRLDEKQWSKLVAEIEDFPSFERRRTFQQAYER